MVQEVGYAVSNHKSDPLGFLFMRFDTYEEMMQIMVQRYGDITIRIRKDA